MKKTQSTLLTLLPLLLTIVIDTMGTILVLPILTPLLLSPTSPILPLHLSVFLRDFLFTFTLALFPLAVFFAAPVLGDLSDKLGRKKILIICLIGSSASYVVAALAVYINSLSLLLLSRIISGLFAGTQSIAQAAIIDLSSLETRTHNLGLAVLAATLGFVIGPTLSGVLADTNLVSWFSFTTPFIVAALLALGNCLLLAVIFKETFQAKASQKVQIFKGFIMLLAAFDQRNLRLISMAFFSFILSFALFFQCINWLFLQKFNYTPSQLGIYTGFMGLIFAIAVSWPLRFLLKRLKEKSRVILVCLPVMSGAMLLAAFANTSLLQWLLTIFSAGSNAICYALILALYSHAVDDDAQGWIMGVTGAVGGMAWVVAGLIAGPLGFLDLSIPFIIAGGLAMLSFVCILMYQKNLLMLNQENIC